MHPAFTITREYHRRDAFAHEAARLTALGFVVTAQHEGTVGGVWRRLPWLRALAVRSGAATPQLIVTYELAPTGAPLTTTHLPGEHA